MENTMTGRNVGKTCRTHYRGTFNDAHSLIHLMIAVNRWNSYAVRDR